MKLAMFAGALGAFLVLLAGRSAAQGGQRIEGDRLVDEDFRFAITRPDPGWKLLGVAEARQIVPDAAAGIMKPPGLFCVVVVEPAPEGTAETWARTIIDNLPLEGKTEEVFEATTFCDRPAIRAQNTGRTSDLAVRFQHVIVMNEGHLFQIIAWGSQDLTKADGSSFAPAVKTVALLPGKIRGRSAEARVTEATGVGWLVRSGRFASAAYGFAVEPAGEWRLAVGKELTGMNGDAEVGLVHTHAYMIAICERAAGVDKAAFMGHIRDSAAAGRETSGKPLDVKVGGEAVTLLRYAMGDSAEFTLYHGAFFRNDICIQVQAWFMAKLETEAMAALPAAFEAFRFLDAKEREQVAAAIDAKPDSTNVIGMDHAFRQGVYRNFRQDITWKRPAGFWRISTGDAARQRNADASLFFEEPSAGLMGMVIAEDADGAEGARYHDTVVRNLTGEKTGDDATAPIPAKFGSVDGLVTKTRVASGATTLDYAIATAVTPKRAVQCLIWGLPGNAATAQDRITAALGGLSVHPSGLPETTTEGLDHADERLGFSLKSPAEGAQLRDILPAGSLKAAGTGVMWQSKSSIAFVVAVCALSDDQDPAWFDRFVVANLVENLSRNFGGRPSESAGAIAGHDCSRLTWTKGFERLEINKFVRDRTFFAVGFGGRAPSIAAARDGFTLLP